MMFMVLSSWQAIARVHPVHVVCAPDCRQASGWLGLWVRR